MMRGMGRLSIIGVPSSAGSYAAGQDQAPAALRQAGLIQALRDTGFGVRDHGDLPEQIWRPDRQHPLAQNAGQVTICLQELAGRLGPLLADGDTVLVVGGNCTIALAVMAALEQLTAGTPGLLYVDRHYDLNTPQSTLDGALDWMGLAHAFALPGTVDALTDAFGHRPLLQPAQVALLGIDASRATAWELGQAERLGLNVTACAALAADPRASASAALGVLPPGPLAVHVDVDVLDFIDAPLAENTDGRNYGPTLDQLAEVLLIAAADPRLRALSVGELNPTRSVGEPDAIARFIRMLAATIGAVAGGRS
jgi:arginase